jgi:hypothetical protein
VVQRRLIRGATRPDGVTDLGTHSTKEAECLPDAPPAAMTVEHSVGLALIPGLVPMKVPVVHEGLEGSREVAEIVGGAEGDTVVARVVRDGIACVIGVVEGHLTALRSEARRDRFSHRPSVAMLMRVIQHECFRHHDHPQVFDRSLIYLFTFLASVPGCRRVGRNPSSACETGTKRRGGRTSYPLNTSFYQPIPKTVCAF